MEAEIIDEIRKKERLNLWSQNSITNGLMKVNNENILSNGLLITIEFIITSLGKGSVLQITV